MENVFLCGIGRSFGGYRFLHIMRGLEAGHDLIPYLAELSRDQIEEGLWVNLSPTFYNLSLKENCLGLYQGRNGLFGRNNVLPPCCEGKDPPVGCMNGNNCLTGDCYF